MPRDPFGPVRAGEPLRFSATRENALTELLLGGRQHNFAADASPSAHARTIYVRNTTESLRQRFDVVGLGDAIFLPTANENEAEFHRLAAFDFVAPAFPLHYSRYAVLQEPIRAAGIGKALLAGVTSCKINVATADAETGHQYAKLKHNTYGYLDSAPCGVARILWKAAGTGEVWAKVLLGAPSPAGLLARTPGGGISAASGSNFPYTFGSASCDVAIRSGGTAIDAGWNATIYNITSFAVAGNKLINVGFDDVGTPFVIVEGCEA